MAGKQVDDGKLLATEMRTFNESRIVSKREMHHFNTSTLQHFKAANTHSTQHPSYQGPAPLKQRQSTGSVDTASTNHFLVHVPSFPGQRNSNANVSGMFFTTTFAMHAEAMSKGCMRGDATNEHAVVHSSSYMSLLPVMMLNPRGCLALAIYGWQCLQCTGERAYKPSDATEDSRTFTLAVRVSYKCGPRFN